MSNDASLRDLVQELFDYTTPENDIEKFTKLVATMAENGWWKRAGAALRDTPNLDARQRGYAAYKAVYEANGSTLNNGDAVLTVLREAFAAAAAPLGSDTSMARPEAEYVKKVCKALRAGHQYSGIVDEIDVAAADLIETLYLAALPAKETIIERCAQIARDYFEKFDDTTQGMLRANNKAVGADIAKEILALNGAGDVKK